MAASGSARLRLAALRPRRPARSGWRLSALALLGAAVGQSPCPNACSSHGVCFNGTCTCESNFTGLDCSSKTCPNDCGGESNGLCMADGVCECRDGFGPLTPGGVNDCLGRLCTTACSRHGTCDLGTGECACEPGWTGLACGEPGCPARCSGHGLCNTSGTLAVCECDTGFSGADCAIQACTGDCSARGACIGGRCRCLPGFAGPNCERRRCPDDCGGHGRCVQPPASRPTEPPTCTCLAALTS